jgi:hypothetical protein
LRPSSIDALVAQIGLEDRRDDRVGTVQRQRTAYPAVNYVADVTGGSCR